MKLSIKKLLPRFNIGHLTLITPILFLILFISHPLKSSAHAYSASYTNISMEKDKTTMEFSLDTLSIFELLPSIDQNKNWILDSSEIKKNKHHLEELITEGLTLDKGNQEQTPEVKDMKIIKKKNKEFLTVTMIFPAFTPGDTLNFNDGFYYNDSATNYINLITASYMGEKSEGVLEGKNRTWTMLLTEVQQEQQADGSGTAQEDSGNGASDNRDGETVQANAQNESVQGNAEQKSAGVTATTTSSSWLSFLKLGMHHILFGYDHLLFLLSLLIARQSFKQIVATITAFTVAHSITLTFSVLGIINVPASIVEPAIALSICYVALENIFRKDISHRWVLTFVFGLIHGMGFADILKEMNLPKSSLAIDLASFNIGIEIIQLAIVALLLPVLTWVYRSKYSKQVIIGVSSLAFVLGGIWLIERVI
ncbi:HupE/UreJ family protein [Rummeliibacillus pycnus]|uniref:HupE/UreJ family protein n=1 Tax=Rummeliibacillus pycnus TaxID=101070 RepID=UPI0037C68D93